MLLKPLKKYLAEIESAVLAVKDAYTEVYEEELLAPERLNLRLRIRFNNGNLLELNEAVIFHNGVEHLGYRYHFQDAENKLIFRYDNTPHFPNLETFPHHKHDFDKVSSSKRPSMIEVLHEAQDQCLQG
jgi:hypothetical protein